MMTDPTKQAKIDEILDDARKARAQRKRAEIEVAACKAAQDAADLALERARMDLTKAQLEYGYAIEEENFALEVVGPALLSGAIGVDPELHVAWGERA